MRCGALTPASISAGGTMLFLCIPALNPQSCDFPAYDAQPMQVGKLYDLWIAEESIKTKRIKKWTTS